MRAPLLLLGGIVVLSIAVARALSCVCSPLECDILTDEDCPGGLTWDPCRCCKVCARVEGEPCGGLFGFSGSCAVGLQCVIKNLLHHTREVDEGVCTKIPGRWRRHCPHGPIMSGPGCNLVGEGTASETGTVLPGGKCVCGPPVPWCPDEPPPYVYMTRHECKLNLAAKIAYDDLFNSGDTTVASVDPDNEGSSLAADCPEDSIREEDGSCKCSEECPPAGCRSGQRPVQVKPGDPGIPGSCCPQYNCILPDGSESCPEDSVLTKYGECKCLPCLPASCRPGQRPVEVRAASPEIPGSCCPLYECKPSESVSWAKAPADDGEMPQYCIYNGEAKKVGERWQKSACESCICEEDGQQSCQSLMCKSCENAIPPDPGECCPHCPSVNNVTQVDTFRPCTTSLDNCALRCDHGYINDENNCPTCKCSPRKDDTEVDEEFPEMEKSCPELQYCELSCDLVRNEKGCEICACQTPSSTDNPENGSVLVDENGKKICPEVKCDLHCERGLVMDENDCTFCECKPPITACPPLVGCRKRCAFGYKSNKRGCPICRCRASCTDHLNETHPEGSSWNPNACSTCTCEMGGKLSCKETICSVACSNPLPAKTGTCCPVCPITGTKENEQGHSSTRGWGTVPITLIVILAMLCLLLIVHIVRSRFRGRLSPSEASYSTYPPQYYKCVPAYDTPVHRSEKIVPL